MREERLLTGPSSADLHPAENLFLWFTISQGNASLWTIVWRLTVFLKKANKTYAGVIFVTLDRRFGVCLEYTWRTIVDTEIYLRITTWSVSFIKHQLSCWHFICAVKKPIKHDWLFWAWNWFLFPAPFYIKASNCLLMGMRISFIETNLQVSVEFAKGAHSRDTPFSVSWVGHIQY